MDVMRALYLDLTGQPIDADDVPDGRKWMNEAYDAPVAAIDIAAGKLTVADYVRSCQGVAEQTWWGSRRRCASRVHDRHRVEAVACAGRSHNREPCARARTVVSDRGTWLAVTQ